MRVHSLEGAWLPPSAQACGSEACPVSMKLVAAPRYVLTTQTLDKAQARRGAMRAGRGVAPVTAAQLSAGGVEDAGGLPGQRPTLLSTAVFIAHITVPFRGCLVCTATCLTVDLPPLLCHHPHRALRC